MNQADYADFHELWGRQAQVQATQASKPLTDAAIDMVFEDLADFELDEVRDALRRHRSRIKWMPCVADVIALIEGELPQDAVLQSLALDSNRPTPLGVITRHIVGERTMTHGDEYRIGQAIKGKRDVIDAFRLRALVGEYTEDELLRCDAAGADPAGPLGGGCPGARAPFVPLVLARLRDLQDRKALPNGPAPMVDENGVARALTADELASSDEVRRRIVEQLGIRQVNPGREVVRDASRDRDQERESV